MKTSTAELAAMAFVAAFLATLMLILPHGEGGTYALIDLMRFALPG